MSEYQLFTDGACSGNPGPGGWAFRLHRRGDKQVLQDSGATTKTTNNRMEIVAVIRGLEAVDGRADAEILTDSMYVGKGLSQWMPNWKANGWRRRKGCRWTRVINEDLWRRMDELAQRHHISFTHVEAHSGIVENERCHDLAVAAYRKLLHGNGNDN